MGHCKDCNNCNMPDKLTEIANRYKDIEGGIMSALHEVQDEYGYISEDAQRFLSRELNVPMSDIYGIITFYSRFSLKPKGKYNIQICLGTACYVKGAEDVLNKFKEELKIEEGQVTPDGKFSLETVRCIGACGLAPAIVINSEVYGNVTENKVKEILLEYGNKE